MGPRPPIPNVCAGCGHWKHSLGLCQDWPVSSLKKADTLGAGSSQEQPPNCSSDRRGALLRKQWTSVSPQPMSQKPVL